MKKKILCLALCALMIIASFVGCGEKSRDELMNQIGEDTSKGAVTLTMYILADSKVSAEQELLVENAVNAIVDAYKIKLDLKYFTEDEYYTTLEKNLAKMKTYYGNKEHLGKETEAPVYTDENGLPSRYYPPVEDFQVDLFYFSGYDKYLEYKNAEYLADFEAELINSASGLKGNISSIFYQNVKKINGSYNMMPTNTAVGEYTYMLVHKDVLKSTQYASSQIVSPVSDECAELLAMVNNFYPEYEPFYSSEGVLVFDDVKFFGTDANGATSNDFSILAGTYNSDWVSGAKDAYPTMSGINATTDSGNGNVIDQIKRLKNYEISGYYSAADSSKPFAVGYIKGGLEVIDQYSEDYEITVVDTPTLTTEAFYENVIAISSQNKSLSSSARILAELYTNEALINLLAHGVEGENYIWTNSDVLDKNDNPYRVIRKQAKDDRYIYDIAPERIGNLAAVYPTVDDDPARSERILAQNSDAKLDLLFGYSLIGAGQDLAPMAKIEADSKTAYDKIIAAKNNAELDEAIDEMNAMLESDEAKAVLEKIGAYYLTWLTGKGIYEAPAAAA